ncbi:hypothetical protein EXIGLDRAFT_681030 [Exidia glandulosa HHB12029]|uniref:Uncharacterized protein n=1 Tax=Exidia glandulosa HHB12029 TaxID=1314781 RepID=A0A165EA01_EXIGL|nr:hypothetical protein EXIGLDRAFT_681030 [Exidia glandulosa HHB12029]
MLTKFCDSLTIPIKYVPRKEAGVPAPSRALAYETETPIPDPAVDPAAWHSETAELDVRAFGARDVHVTCTQLSLPLPLEYARGHWIPFHLAVSCGDEQVLDLLSTPGALDVVLDRQLRLSETKKRASEARESPPNAVGHGRYWPVRSADRPVRTRCFEGEIKVIAQLMQSFSYPRLALSVSMSYLSRKC